VSIGLAASQRLCNTAAVGAGLLSFVGRADELRDLRAASRAAARGSGGLWLVTGEAGIGKSRLLEEIAADAQSEGVSSHWGRCWESGGAPAYWPWIQILRSLVRPDRALPTPIQQLLSPSNEETSAPAHPERARFELFDAVAAFLLEATRAQPRLIAVEDLHCADASSLMLLDFLSHPARGAGLLLIGTARDPSRTAGGDAPLFHQVARSARSIGLGRLDRPAVADYLQSALADAPSALVDGIFERTEGHPLFLAELVRLLRQQPGAQQSQQALAIPATMRSAIREHLTAVSAPCRYFLQVAAVLGRDVDVARAAALADVEPAAAQELTAEATRAGLLSAVPPRFSHMLIREVALGELDEPRRESLQRAAAELLERAGGAWSTIAHHWQAAGGEYRNRAVAALRRAANEAVGLLAFDEAAAFLQTGLELVDDDAQAAGVELRTELGEALIRAGNHEAGRRACMAAAAGARALGRVDLLAAVGLGLGSVLRHARVDTDLVALLEEANRGLGDTESPLRARVLARHAAAVQPATDPAIPVALARKAIAMARSVGDDATLLEVLRTGCSAFVDVTPPADRIDANREHLALARRRGANADVYRAALRLAMNEFELGNRPAAEAAIRELTAAAERFDHDAYRWRALALRATRALWVGDFAAAETLMGQAAEAGRRAGDASARQTSTYQRLRLYRLTGRTDELAALVPELRGLFADTPVDFVGTVAAAAAEQLAGRTAGPTQLAEALSATLQFGDRTALGDLAELAHARSDRNLAAVLVAKTAGAETNFVSRGVAGMTWDEPVQYSIALARETMGAPEEAARHLEAGILAARRLDGAPTAAWLALDYGRLHSECGAGSSERARELIEYSQRVAAELDMAGVATRAAQLANALAPATPVSAPVIPPTAVDDSPAATASMNRDGDVWLIELGDVAVRARASKGLLFLSHLVRAPGESHHVLDLVAADAPEGAIDVGDAGPVVDEQAVAAYRSRARDLREELDEAEANGDLGRAERVRSELEFLTSELSRAVGLRGPRRTGQNVERARVNVQRRIRDALRRIAELDPGLGRHFERAVKTGRFCSYAP